MKTPIRMLLEQKTDHLIYTIAPDASISELVEKINRLNVGALFIISKGELQGIISERDVIRKIVGGGLDLTKVKVEEIMTTDVISITPADTVSKAMAIMTHKRIRHLPVLDNGKVIAMISIGDLTKWIIEQQQKDINDLTHYINNEPAS